MPLYEYRCTQCGHQFEHIQTFSAPDLKACKVCAGALERLISAPALRFSGSGFYETDYKSKPKSEKSSDAPASSDKSSASTTDTSSAKQVSSAAATSSTAAASTAASSSSSSSNSSSHSSTNKSSDKKS